MTGTVPAAAWAPARDCHGKLPDDAQFAELAVVATHREVQLMPAVAAPVADEREGLLAYLAQQRLVLRITAYGLTDDQARATPTASPLSVGGLIKHLARVERGWMVTVMGRAREWSPEQHEAGFRLAPGETLAGVLEQYERAAEETDAIIEGIPDLGQPVPVPREVPWAPGVTAWSVRWVLLHLIEETARHAGHADIIRESLDGATAFALMAAAEGWSAHPWAQPWRPPPAPHTPSTHDSPSDASLERGRSVS